MPTVIDEVTAEVMEQPAAEPERTEMRGRQPPDMVRIQLELRRDAERCQRLWCD